MRNRYLSAPVPLILLALFILPACEKNEPVREGPRELVLNKKSAGIIRADSLDRLDRPRFAPIISTRLR